VEVYGKVKKESEEVSRKFAKEVQSNPYVPEDSLEELSLLTHEAENKLKDALEALSGQQMPTEDKLVFCLDEEVKQN